MTTDRMKQFITTFGQRAVNNWPSKLFALLLGFIIWFLIVTSDTSTTQRSFVLPLEIEGITGNVVPVGIPDVVEVSVSGQSSRIDRLRADLFQVVLDLTDATGTFQRTLQVQVPQDVTLVSVTPSEVIGTLEGATSEEFPVVLTIGSLVTGVVESVVDPATVIVTGQASLMSRVATVRVLTTGAGEQVIAPIAFDENGRPLNQVRFEPPTVTVNTTTRVAYVASIVPLTVNIDGDVEFSVSHSEVTVIAPQVVVDDITELSGTVSVPAETEPGGRYTAEVNIVLPDGAFIEERVLATIDIPVIPEAPQTLE